MKSANPMEPTVSSSGEIEGKSVLIQGCQVYFPHGRNPFPAQLAVMSKVLSAAKEGKHALLESPTGTGKVSLFS